MNKLAGLDILIYVFMVAIPLATMILAAKIKGLSLLGLFGGLLAGIFTYVCFTSDTLILNTVYDQTAQVFVNQTYAMGVFAWVPLLLAVGNLIIAAKN